MGGGSSTNAQQGAGLPNDHTTAAHQSRSGQQDLQPANRPQHQAAQGAHNLSQ
jgi:hypothetical protein